MSRAFARHYVCARCGRGTDSGVVINQGCGLVMGPVCARKAGLTQIKSRRAPESVAKRVENPDQLDMFMIKS